MVDLRKVKKMSSRVKTIQVPHSKKLLKEKEEALMKRIIYIIIFTVTLVTLLALLIANFFANEDFFKATLVQCVPLFLSFLIAFWATQYKNDSRKHKDHAERIIFKLQEIVTNERFYKIFKKNLMFI